MIDTVQKTDQLEIIPMTLADLDEVLEIERDSFSTPWSRDGFRQEINDPSRSFSIVAKQKGCIVGYGVAWLVVDEIYIANLAVHRAHRRKGIGRRLLHILLQKGTAHQCQLATLEVRQSNHMALNLYMTFGFSAIAWRKGYYRDTGEDALVMVKYLKAEDESNSSHDLVHDAGREI
jgi:ribosomal-protein-alanine N-acetyltransferase